MRRWTLGLAVGLLAAASCKSDEQPDAQADATPRAEPKDGAEAPPPSDPGKPGKGLAATFELALHGGGEVRGIELIPAGAVVIGGVDVASLAKLPIWTSLHDSLPSRERGFMDAGTACGVGPETWRSFVIGTEPASRNMAMVATAEGLGKAETLRCLSSSLGFALDPDAKRMSDHTGGGIVLDEDSIAFATPTWMPLLEERIAGQGAKATDGKLKAVLARTDQTKTLWFAGAIPEDMQSTARLILQDNLHDAAGWADLTAGAKVNLSFAVDDAQGVQGRLQTQWEGAKGMAASSGVPQGVVDSVSFTHKDDVVMIELVATQDEIRTITGNVMRSMGI